MSDYQVRHQSYSSAVSCALNYYRNKGYDFNDDQVFNDIATHKRPGEGQTNRFSLEVLEGFKDVDTHQYTLEEMLHIQIYNDGTMYELNMYLL